MIHSSKGTTSDAVTAIRTTTSLHFMVVLCHMPPGYEDEFNEDIQRITSPSFKVAPNSEAPPSQNIIFDLLSWWWKWGHIFQGIFLSLSYHNVSYAMVLRIND